jgi:hypothetical protein
METPQDEAVISTTLPQQQSPVVKLLKSSWINVILLVLALLTVIFIILMIVAQGKASPALGQWATAILFVGYLVGIVRSIFRFGVGGGSSFRDHQRQAKSEMKRQIEDDRINGRGVNLGLNGGSAAINGLGNYLFSKLFFFVLNVAIWPVLEIIAQVRYLSARWSAIKNA